MVVFTPTVVFPTTGLCLLQMVRLQGLVLMKMLKHILMPTGTLAKCVDLDCIKLRGLFTELLTTTSPLIQPMLMRGMQHYKLLRISLASVLQMPIRAFQG